MRHRRDTVIAKVDASLREERFGDAEAEASTWLARHPRDKFVRLKLAGLLKRQGRAEDVHRLVVEGVGRRRATAIDQAVSRMKKDHGILDEPWEFLIEGVGSVGLIHHRLSESRHLISKIVDRRTLAGRREVAFYTRWIERSDSLRSVAPVVVDVRPIPRSRLTMITMERVSGGRAKLCDLPSVLGVWLKLSHAYSELAPREPLLVRSYVRDLMRSTTFGWSRGRPLHPEMFAWIHKRSGMSRLFARLRDRARSAPRIMEAVQELERYWLGGGLLGEIDPSRHFSLMHGDFHGSNLIKDEEHVKLIDWATLSIGPPEVDLARFMTGFSAFSFLDLEERVFPFLDEHADRGSVLPYRRPLIVLAVVARWLTHVPSRALLERYDSTLAPAIAWFRSQHARADARWAESARRWR
jgi:hypothetical protein